MVLNSDIPTALTLEEKLQLRREAAERSVLEIGSLLGASTVILASVAERVVSVDPHEGYPEDDPKPTLIPFLENLNRYDVREKVTVCVGTDKEVLPLLASRQFGLVFIDATGKYDDTLRIMRAAHPLLSHHATLAVHDYGHPDWPGAQKAVEDFAFQEHRRFDLYDRLALFHGTWG